MPVVNELRRGGEGEQMLALTAVLIRLVKQFAQMNGRVGDIGRNSIMDVDFGRPGDARFVKEPILFTGETNVTPRQLVNQINQPLRQGPDTIVFTELFGDEIHLAQEFGGMFSRLRMQEHRYAQQLDVVQRFGHAARTTRFRSVRRASLMTCAPPFRSL